MWYQKSVKDIIEQFKSSVDLGLTKSEAEAKLLRDGENSLKLENLVSPIAIFFQQFKNPLIIILLFGVLLSIYSQHIVDAIAISVIIMINVLIGFLQEMNMHKSMDTLKNMSTPIVQVKRDGEWLEISLNF